MIPNNRHKEGQGFNDARGEVEDKKDIPKNNGQNINNDPAHLAEREKRKQKSLENQRTSKPVVPNSKDHQDTEKLEDELLHVRKNT